MSQWKKAALNAGLNIDWYGQASEIKMERLLAKAAKGHARGALAAVPGLRAYSLQEHR